MQRPAPDITLATWRFALGQRVRWTILMPPEDHTVLHVMWRCQTETIEGVHRTEYGVCVEDDLHNTWRQVWQADEQDLAMVEEDA